MKKYLLSLFLSATSLLLTSHIATAQHDGHKPHHTQSLKSKKLNALNFIKVTGGLGLSTYYGDICDGAKCYQFRYSFTMGAYYRYSPRLSIKADFFYTRIGNDDKIYKTFRNLGFRTDILELSAMAMVDVFKFEHKFERRRTVEPYVQLGIGLAYYNPQGKMDGHWYSLRQYHTEGKSYGSFTPVIPMGFGLRTRLRHDLNISAEFVYRITFTDYLDDVSGKNYKDPNTFAGGPNSTAAELSNRSDIPYFPEKVRGNPNKNDGYFTFNVRLEYMIAAFTDQSKKGNLNRIPTGRKTIKRR
jgi:hypothetical protein